MSTDYEPPSRRVSRESLGSWVMKDAMAHRAVQAGITEAELIHALLEDRKRLMEQLHESLSDRPPLPITLAQPEPVGPTDEELTCAAEEAGFCYESDGCIFNSHYEGYDIRREVLSYARAVLQRWGSHAITPIPVAERLPEADDTTDRNECWYWHPGEECWEMVPVVTGTWDEWSHWLPHHALPLPAT